MRTQLTDSDGKPLYTNRLLHEGSPYLQQHAHNPVDWYPWGDAAFENARQTERPIFLSIGYSTCHWCHVMERESFDNETIAHYLNEHFVCIKVDREQHPELDDIYMTGVQLLTGQGGWPMSSFLTPEGEPFYAGTYYPPDGFLKLLEQLKTAWLEQRDNVLAEAGRLTAEIRDYLAAQAESENLDASIASDTAAALLKNLDGTHGGFGDAPKFPAEPQLMLLQDVVARTSDQTMGEALDLTLNRMACGGIFDQVAGGFHRYSVDASWLVPHFEKMLYNQAQLLMVYARGLQLTGNEDYRVIIERTVDYLQQEMLSPDNRFYSATDADSEGEEGRFFIWQWDELQAVLTPDEFKLVQEVYQVTPEGNFEGANILHLQSPLVATARDRAPGFIAEVESMLAVLYHRRQNRERPLRDEKLITGWNAMMISALVQVELMGGVPGHAAIAEQVADALWQHHWQGNTLSRVAYADPAASEGAAWEQAAVIAGNLEDYAYFAEACFYLYLSTQQSLWLERGRLLTDRMLEEFWDADRAGFFFSREDAAGPMITRPKSPADTAIRAGNGVALMAMVMAIEAGGGPELQQRVNEMIAGFAGTLKRQPTAFSSMLVAIERHRKGSLDPVQWGANGNLRVALTRRQDGVYLEFDLRDGWHINGEQATDELLATQIEGVEAAHWPTATGLSAESYGGSFEVRLEAPQEMIQIDYQACSDELCLTPKSLRLRLPAALAI